eukprot:18706-Chlamydomonas_euryale.AAC.2
MAGRALGHALAPLFQRPGHKRCPTVRSQQAVWAAAAAADAAKAEEAAASAAVVCWSRQRPRLAACEAVGCHAVTAGSSARSVLGRWPSARFLRRMRGHASRSSRLAAAAVAVADIDDSAGVAAGAARMAAPRGAAGPGGGKWMRVERRDGARTLPAGFARLKCAWLGSTSTSAPHLPLPRSCQRSVGTSTPVVQCRAPLQTITTLIPRRNVGGRTSSVVGHNSPQDTLVQRVATGLLSWATGWM